MSIGQIIQLILSLVGVSTVIYFVSDYLSMKRRERVRRIYDDAHKGSDEARDRVYGSSVDELLRSAREIADTVRKSPRPPSDSSD